MATMSTIQQALASTVSLLLERNRFRRIDVSNIRFQRETKKIIEVVQFDVHPPGLCKKWGVPPYSFSTGAGVYFLFVPSFDEDSIVVKDGLPCPAEEECHLRMNVVRTTWQWRCNVPNIWCVKKNGKNLDALMANVRSVLQTEIFNWFRRIEDIPELAHHLINDMSPKKDAFRRTYSITLGVPIQLPGYIALEADQPQIAKELLVDALNSKIFDENYENIQRVQKRIQDTLNGIRLDK